MFHGRRHERVKRRFACEFLVEGKRYRGIVVELSRGGLFVQTDATTAPGKKIDVYMAGSGAVPDLLLRAVVVRRRMVPTMLAGVVRRGIALEILEAPREYGLACSSRLLDVPIGNPLAGGALPDTAPTGAKLQRPTSRAEAGASRPNALEPALPAPSGRSESPQRTAPAPLPASDTSEAEQTDVLVVDDGSLADVDALLQGLGADVRRLTLASARTLGPFKWPRRLFVTTAQLACSLHLPEPPEKETVVAIAIAEDESQTLSAMMRRLGFQYLVHRPIHPEAMRLLLRKVLYRGGEQRRTERLPFGIEVTWRSGWAKQRGVLVEISSTGCRLQADRALPPGSRVRIAIPAAETGDKRISLRGRTLRRDNVLAASPDTRHSLALCFDPLPTRVQQHLDALLVRLARGPATLPRGATAPLPAAPDAVAPGRANESETPTAAAPTIAERRRAARVRLDREVVALDETATRALHALMGRDLSLGGMRIDPIPDLVPKQRLRLALYEPSARRPVVLAAEVARDDGGAGLALRFVDVAPEVATELERIIAAIPALESLRPEPRRILLGAILDDRSVA